MQIHASVFAVSRYAVILVVVIGSVVPMSSAKKTRFTVHDKEYFADANTVNFVRPGLLIKVVSANIATDGTISVDYKLTDLKGLPLDLAGVTTPGAIAVSFLADYIPKGQTQFVSYATRSRASVDGKTTVTQAAADAGGTQKQVGDGEYLYTFATKAPAGWDPKATHRVGIYGSRNLTEFGFPTNYDDAVFDFVPGGGTPAPREVIKTVSCNKCHDTLAHHGGSRRSLELCILCHTPQTSDPNTGNTVDMKVMAHKIHMGSQLPSVIAGKPYQIGGAPNPSDWSTVVFPSDPRRCEACHEPKTGAAQANAWMTNPNRAACGACHDNVNFATGANHVNLPQADDNQCAQCHIPQGELEFDVSIRGAHTVPQESTTRPGIVVNLTKVDNGAAGKQPTVTFTLKDSSGAPIPLSALGASPGKIAFTMAGPTTDYGYTSFGSDVTSPGYVAETATTAAQCGTDGTCTYTFTHAVPAGAKGTYAIGIEARRGLTLLAGTVQQQTTEYGADNKLIYFSVDGSPAVKRRQVVAVANCNQCHTRLSLHGESRNQTEYCVLCHNPSNTAGTGAAAVPIDFPVMVHRLHYGDNMQAFGATYKIGTTDFTGVRFPTMNDQGTPGDTAKCYVCHVNGTEAVLPIGMNPVKNPNGLLDPMPATTAVCTACHLMRSTLAHAAAQTDPKFGESCDVCHAAGAEFDVQKVHAGK